MARFISPLGRTPDTKELSSSTDFTVDATTDIVLDADGGDILFKDGGTTIGEFTNSSSDLVIKSSVSDKDILVKGNDGGSAITAITLDMSAAGKATFNDEIVSGAVITSGAGLVIADAGNIGSASDTDAIAIASNGVVTFSQAPVFPDGSIDIADIDLDGGTDIGASIVDADLFLIDDGAGGTMRKTAASRLKTYINASAAGSVNADDIAAGDAAVTLTTTTGDITIDAAANDSDIILKGTDGGADTTFLTIDGSAAGAASFNGVVTVNAGVVVDNITIDGTEIDLSSGDLTLDVAGDIILDAAGDEVIFKDGSTNVGHVSMDSDNLTIKSLVSDKDIILQGNDGGSGITALTLDMSAAGAATFNGAITGGGLLTTGGNIVIPDAGNIGSASDTDAVAIASDGQVTVSQGLTVSGNLDISDTIFHTGDSNTKIRFPSVDTISFHTSGSEQMSIGSDGVVTFADDIKIKDGGTIGSASDADAISIASNGVVTFSQAVSGTSADFDGGVTIDNITIDGTEIDLSSGDLTVDVAGDIILDADGGDFKFQDGGTEILRITNSSSDVVIRPVVDAKDIIFQQRDGTEVARIEDNGTFNVVTDKFAINGTAVTATAAEINLIDGGTSRGTTAIADGDGVLINDAGTMRMTTVQTLAAYLDDEITAMPNLTSVGTLTALTVDDVAVNGKVITMTGSTDDTAVFTVGTNGTLTIETTDTAAAAANIQVTADGTFEVDATTITLDSAGDIVLDADGANVTFKDGGTAIGDFSNSSSDFVITASVQDKDIIFKGDDGGSAITALTLDMSAAGAATFNSTVTSGAGVVIADGGNIGSASDTDSIAIASDGVVTFSQKVVIDGGIDVDNFHFDGATIALSSGDMVLDGAGDIILDADGADVIFKDGGTAIGTFTNSSSDFVITANVQDKDILFKGDDGGSGITALTLDMSAAGAATFNAGITSGAGLLIADDGTIGSASDTDAITIAANGNTTFSQSVTVSGNLTVSGTTTQVNTVTMNAENAVVFEGATADAHETTLTIIDPTADRTQRLINQSGFIPLLAATTTTAITSTPAELNLLDGSSANSVVNSKAVIYGSSGELAGTLSTAAQTNVTSLGTLSALTVDDVAINGKVITMTGSSSDTAVFTVGTNGTLSIVTTDDAAAAANIQITADGTFETDATTITLDSAGDIVLDADGADVIFKDGGTTILSFTNSSSDAVITSGVQDKDIIFKGDDGGSAITALTLDMSGAGAATFNDAVTSGAVITSGAGLVIADGGNIGSSSDTDAIAIASDGVVTFSQKVVIDGGIDVDNFHFDGATIALSSGDMILDGAGDIILDADGADVIFKDGGTAIGTFTNSSSDFVITSNVQDKDIIFKGDDGGSAITALTLDMSAAGAATFNGAITGGGLLTTGGNIVIPDDGNIGSASDTDAIAIAANGTVTFSAAVAGTSADFDGGVTIDNITIDGTEIDLSSGDLTLDVAGDIILNADGADIKLADASVTFGHLSNSSSDFVIEAKVQDKDIIFKGDDGGSGITALTLDMSAAGAATFNGAITGGGLLTTGGNIVIPDDGNIGSASDTDAIAIAADGVVTMNQIPVFSAGINVSGGNIAGTLSTAAQTNITSVGTLTALTVDDVAINGKVITMTGSSSDTAVFTVGTNGTLSIVTTDDAAAAANIQITADGTAELAGTTVTLDSGGDIVLDADGADVIFKDGGTTILSFTNSSSDAVITSGVQDKDIIFKGDDGGSAITALTLDMSAAGAATFNGAITGGGLLTTGGNIVIPDTGNIGSASDTDAIAIAANGVVTFSQAPVFPDGSINIADIDLDGGTDIGAAIVDADLFLIDDGAGGTMRKTAASRLKTYIGAGAADDLTAGDAAVTLTTSSGNITIDAAANDSDIILKGTDGGADTTFLTIDGSAAGEATFNAGIVIADAGNIGSASDKDAIAIGSDGDVTLTQDLELQHDGAILSFGADDEVTLTHVHNDGLLLNADMQLQFRDSAINIRSDADGDLDINADDEIELNSTLIDINGAVDISGATTVGGILKTDDATEATSTTDGSLQTDGGLSVVKDAVFGDDVKLLSDAAVMSFGANSEITLTHVHDVGLNLKHTATADDKPIILTLQTGETDMAANDVMGAIRFQAPDEGTGTDAILVAAAIQAVSEGDFANNNNATRLEFHTAASEAAAAKMTLSSAGVLDVDGGVTIDNITIDGTEIDLSSGDLTLDVAGDIILNADGADIKLADASVTFGHLSNSSSDFVIEAKVQDKDIIFKGDDGGSGITALTLDMSAAGAATFNGAITGGGLLTTGGNIVIPDDGNIGSASDTDSIAIAADGVVTMNQIPVFSAGINVSGGNIAGTLSTAAQTNITSVGTLTALTVDDVAINGKVITMTGSSSDTAVFTAGTNGTLSIVTTDAAAAAANITITADGTFEADGTTITLDSGGDIVLDADGADVIFKDGGTAIGTFTNSSSDFVITANVQDKDILFKGDDGGSAITALTLDMSAAGAATFRSTITCTPTATLLIKNSSGSTLKTIHGVNSS